MSTFCNRNELHFAFSLHTTIKCKACCHTPFREVKNFQDPLDEPWYKQRIHDHKNNIQNPDCAHCWNLEANSLFSPRNAESIKDTRHPKLLEIQLNNTCNMACLYCFPASSSIWAEKIKDPVYNQSTKRNSKIQETFQQNKTSILNWMSEQLAVTGLDTIENIVLTGGEPTLIDDFYTLVDIILQSGNKINVHINTNLMTTENRLGKFLQAIENLHAQGNSVVLRCSVDGIDSQQEWQRTLSNWKIMQYNLDKISRTPAQIRIAPTVTPLTLESLLPLFLWIQEYNRTMCTERLLLEPSPSLVTSPLALSPEEWFGCFAAEVNECLSMVRSGSIKPVNQEMCISTMENWVKKQEKPSDTTIRNLVKFLDTNQQLWNLPNWREIFPKIAKHCEQSSA